MKKKGWIKVDRNLLDQPFWNERPFSKGQAWIDLLLNVHWANGYDRVGGRKKYAHSGQLWTTYPELADRWGWSKAAVNRFLHKLAETESVTLCGTAFGTLITLKNWDLYQHGETLNETQDETPSESPSIYIKNKEETSDPFGADDPDDDEGMTEEEWNELIRVQGGGS